MVRDKCAVSISDYSRSKNGDPLLRQMEKIEEHERSEGDSVTRFWAFFKDAKFTYKLAQISGDRWDILENVTI